MHRVNLVHKKGTSSQIPADGNGTIKTSKAPSINNSISPKDTKVKSDIDINNKSMKVNKNYTPKNKTNLKNVQNNKDDNIKSFKKNTSKLAKTGNIKYNSNGIKLEKKEYASVVSAINTDNPNIPKGISYKFYNNYFFYVSKKDFGYYDFIAKVSIESNEEFINKIRKEIDNGTLKESEKINSIIKEFRTSRRGNNNNYDSSKRTKTNG